MPGTQLNYITFRKIVNEKNYLATRNRYKSVAYCRA